MHLIYLLSWIYYEHTCTSFAYARTCITFTMTMHTCTTLIYCYTRTTFIYLHTRTISIHACMTFTMDIHGIDLFAHKVTSIWGLAGWSSCAKSSTVQPKTWRDSYAPIAGDLGVHWAVCIMRTYIWTCACSKHLASSVLCIQVDTLRLLCMISTYLRAVDACTHLRDYVQVLTCEMCIQVLIFEMYISVLIFEMYMQVHTYLCGVYACTHLRDYTSTHL